MSVAVTIPEIWYRDTQQQKVPAVNLNFPVGQSL